MSDASLSSCKTTTCVKGATCTTGNGETCHCIEDGAWSCGTVATPPYDGGFSIDSMPPPFDTAFTAPPADASRPTYYFPLIEGGCADNVAACDEPISIGTANNKIRDLMLACGLSCTNLELIVGGDGCPLTVSLNTEWVAGGLKCIANEIVMYRFPCAKSFNVTTSSCPD